MDGVFVYNPVAHYGITIKIIKKDYFATEEELETIYFKVLTRYKNAESMYKTYENDSLGRIHLHGLFRARKGIRKNLYRQAYVTIHIDYLPEEKDITNWISYIFKEPVRKFLLDVRKEYLFQDESESSRRSDRPTL